MALVPFIQKKGSVGASTFMGGRHGTVERNRVFPTNPDTLPQQNVRGILSAVASEWRGLTDEGRAGWRALAAQMPGNLTGFQAYVQVNATLVNAGLPKQEDAPDLPAFGILTCTGLVADDTPALKLTQVADTVAPDKFIIQAIPAQTPGRTAFSSLWRNLKVVNGHAAPAADIDLAADYTAKFGALKAGQRIAIRILPLKGGFKGVAQQFQAMVAAQGA